MKEYETNKNERKKRIYYYKWRKKSWKLVKKGCQNERIFRETGENCYNEWIPGLQKLIKVQ